MQRVSNFEVTKLSRIARTEMITVINEGRLSAYEKESKLRKKPYKYTLVVASGPRTCDAHRELASYLASKPKGVYLNKLRKKQMEIGAKYGLKLSGNFLLHPNQRTVMMRVIDWKHKGKLEAKRRSWKKQ